MLRFATLLMVILCVTIRPPAAGAQSDDADITFWNSVKDSADPDEFRAYLESFPDGRFAPLARVRIRKLSGAAAMHSDAPEPERQRNSAKVEPASPVIENDIGYIGAQVSDLSVQRAKQAGLGVPQGTRVTETVPGGPADRAGLVIDDIVVKVDAVPVANMRGFLELTKRLKPGQSASFEIIRGDARRTISVVAGGFVADNLVAARSGDARAMHWLYTIYSSDRLGKPDTVEGLKWLNAAVDAGHPPAIHALADLHWNGRHVEKDQQKAARLYQQSADRGHGPAANAVARIHYNGSVGKKDPALALFYFRKAADAGDSAAMYQVGYQNLHGEGTTKNAEEAARWYQRAADAGHAAAMSDLALRYHIGDGVAQDHGRAAAWYDRALKAGNRSGLYNMSLLHATGQGVPKNEALAADYFFQALMDADEFALKQMKTNASGWSTNFRKQIQKKLAEQGLYDGRIDGSIGPQSRNSLDRLFARQKAARAAAAAEATNADAGATEPKSGSDTDLGLGALEDLDSLE